MNKYFLLPVVLLLSVSIAFGQTELIRAGFEDDEPTGGISTQSSDVSTDQTLSTTNGVWHYFKVFRTSAGSATGSTMKLRVLKTSTLVGANAYLITPEVSSVGTISGYSGRGRALTVNYKPTDASDYILAGQNTSGNIGPFSVVVNYSGAAVVKIENPTTSDDDFDDLVVTAASGSGVEVSSSNVPTELSLKNYPNPFNPTTKIIFSVKTTGKTTVKVYDLSGREVAKVFDEVANAGKVYQVPFGFEIASSGIYFARLENKDGIRTQKMVFMK